MHVSPEQLKAFLLDSELATKKQVEAAEKKAATSKQKLGDVLVSEGVISGEQLIKLEAYILGIPYVNIEKEIIDPQALKVIPEPIARKHNIIAFKKAEGTLEVAMLDPEDLQTIDFIKKKSNLKILPRLTNKESIKSALRQYEESLRAEFGELIEKESQSVKVVAEEAGETEEQSLQKQAEEVPIIKIVDAILRHAVTQGASDIHIEPQEKEVLTRYRIDGILHDAMTLPFAVLLGIVARIKVLAELKLDEHRLPQDGRFKIETEDYRVSFRVSILPVYNGEKVVMRLLRENVKGFTLETLGFGGEALEKAHKNLRRPVGMLLVTGPTGSGKTTTLYTMMDIINTPGVNISTIEDPIEYRMPRINQTQVRPDIGLTFANGLRSLVRQDPDVIMVGEIRDSETASLAINAALTGHLVLSTLHTNSAAGALPRLLDMGAEPFLIASTVNLIIAQRLVRKLCPDSRDKYKLTAEELKDVGIYIDDGRVMSFLHKNKIVEPTKKWGDLEFYRAKPSKACPDGYKGRVGIYEVLQVTESIKNLITGRATSDDLEKQARKEGMLTMAEDGITKAAQGITSIEEVLRVTRE
ncbi:MAG: Flp pilus assembly complex ATPase component TadA [Candidatus Spechtbacteria bacterium]|nr:Flp pilus assembly complex ATPase component TadA [Candidatus Spechtbacteria bacterium]